MTTKTTKWKKRKNLKQEGSQQKTLAVGQYTLNKGDRNETTWTALVHRIRQMQAALAHREETTSKGETNAQSTHGICPKNPAPAQTAGVNTFAPSASCT